MSLEPKVGWLLSYSYLWADDHGRGAEEGVKTRPCALVAATRRDGDRIVAIVVPVTHSPPADPETAIEIPAVTKARLGLDALRSWIICTEANVFVWPGPDLRAARRQEPTQHLVWAAAAEARDGGAREAARFRQGRPFAPGAADRVMAARQPAGNGRPEEGRGLASVASSRRSEPRLGGFLRAHKNHCVAQPFFPGLDLNPNLLDSGKGRHARTAHDPGAGTCTASPRRRA